MSYFVSDKYPQGISVVHIPKTAGSSMVNMFKNRKNYFNVGHRTIQEVMFGYDPTLAAPRNYNSLIQKSFKTSVVRNPYGRIRSWFHFMRTYEASFMGHYVKDGFYKFLTDIKEGKNPEVAAWTQTKFLYINDECVMDKLIRFESLSEDFQEVFDEPLVGHKWKTGSQEYDINEQSKDLIYEIYKEDFDNFNYER